MYYKVNCCKLKGAQSILTDSNDVYFDTNCDIIFGFLPLHFPDGVKEIHMQITQVGFEPKTFALLKQ